MDQHYEHFTAPPKRRRISLGGDGMASHVYNRPNMSALRGSEDSSSLLPEFYAQNPPEEGAKCSIPTITKLAGQSIAPFLARHIPAQYAPLGGVDKPRDSSANVNPNTRYCYRHRPDLKCRRQVNEPSMDQLQHVSYVERSKYKYRLIKPGA